EKITQFKINHTKVYIAKFYHVHYTTYVVTEDLNFALHCSDTESESTLLDLDFKLNSLSFSIVSSMLCRELILISIFKKHDLWFVNNTDSILEILDVDSCESLDKFHSEYIKTNATVFEYKLDKNTTVDFNKMILLNDGKPNMPLKFTPYYAFKTTLNISEFFCFQNITLNINCLQIDSPSQDSVNQVILNQTIQPPSLSNKNMSFTNFLVTSLNFTFSTASINDKIDCIEIPEFKNTTSYLNWINLMISHNPLIGTTKTPLQLPCLTMENRDKLETLSELLELSIYHYNQAMKLRFFKLVFGLNAIGNPFASMSQFAQGMKTFFYVPYQGVVTDNKFSKGVLFGVRGLYSGTIGTAANALTSITDTIGKGLATLSFDPNHEADRNKILKMRKVDPLANFEKCALGVFKGIGSGVTGLVTPFVDAFNEKNDFSDMFKGICKGVVGLVAKPVGSLIDFASSGFNLLSMYFKNNR
ncbi:hypothetical protein HZS_2917, partial [Henneguya salminicola]